MARKPRKPMYAIDTVRDAINALGGSAYVASKRRCKPSAIGMWVTYGYVTGGHQVAVLLSLEARGYTKRQINPAIFDLAKWNDALIGRARGRRRPSNGTQV